MYAYNPRKKTFQQLEKSLVGNDRWEILNSILKELSLGVGESPKQHWMIVGPRGIGKSHLMTLLYYKVKKDPKLSDLWIPLLFPEDLRMAVNLSKFLERAANEILLEFDQAKNSISDELKEKIKQISKLPVGERADSLFSIIEWCHNKTGKYFLLLAENLQQLLGRKISLIEQKKLRAFLQTSDALLIIGSATTIFNALHDHSHPFYHFFHIRRLKDLDFDDIKTLIVSLLSESEQPELIKKVSEIDARLKTLYAFTGGNPRMAVFLSDIIRAEAPDEMLEFMDNILDQLTPYFEAIMNDTPDYLEEIINTLAAFEPAQSPKEIAGHLESPQPTIRNYLKQLKETGYTRIAFSKGKSNYYCLNEYLYRIWYQMRDSGHREETRWLMELLLMLNAPRTIIEERNKIESRVDLNGKIFPYQKFIVLAADFIESNPDYCKIIELCADTILTDEKETAKTQKEKKLIQEALLCIKSGLYEDGIKVCKDILNINPKSEDAYLLWGGCLINLEHFEDAIVKLKKEIEMNPKSEDAYWLMGTCLEKMERYEEGIKVFKEHLSESNDIDVIDSYGKCLMGAKRYGEALKQFERLIDIKPDDYPAYLSYGRVLEKMNEKELAIFAYLKHLDLGLKALLQDFDFQETYNEHILPLLKALKSGEYTKQFYASEKERIYSRPQISILLLLLRKYDTVGDHIQDLIRNNIQKDDKKRDDFDLFIFTIKLRFWLHLCEENVHEALRIVDFYLEYIKALNTKKQKEDEVSHFSLDLFRIQIKLNIDGDHILMILKRLEEDQDIPFSAILLKVWTCISEPDSIDAQKYLNDRAILEVVKELKKEKVIQLN
jgi:tetratricopeptide (TPR) repeat protein